jgi:hypothetical protein
VVVIGTERVGEAFGFSGETYRVRLDERDGPDAVIAKMWALRDSGDVRELHFYRELAGDTPIRLPAFHHGDVDPVAGRGWLVLEALDGFRQGDDLIQEPLGTVLGLVATVATVHAAWWDRVAERTWLPRAPCFRRDTAYLETRRSEYLKRFGPLPDPPTRRLFDEIPALVSMADEFLKGAPETLLHLDLGLDNVLFLAPGDRPVPIDWARCGRGPGVHDLASILFGIAPLDGLADVVDGYVASLHGLGLQDVDPGEVRRWLGGAMIHEFVTRTLGVARWAAATPRGLEILDRWVVRTPQVVAAWREFDPELFEGFRLEG